MHPRQHIADLPVILYKKGIADIIISPGSRNAPLINSFMRVFGERCHSIVDERSAGYVALGLAVSSKRPVTLLCTSGTAALNYAPAVAEAFHQGIPLIIITADRPPEWIDQQDNQTIRQAGIYAANVKAIFSMPVEVRLDAECWHARRMANEACNVAMSGRPGPVHINVPLREPLYEEIPFPEEAGCIRISASNTFNEPGDHLKKAWKEARNILLIAGQQPCNKDLSHWLELLSRDQRICIIGEPVSNIRVKGMIGNPDLLLAMDEDQHNLDPDLLIYFGGQVVSSRLKQFLRSCGTKSSWYIDAGGRHVDTFQHLTDVIQADPIHFFEWLSSAEGGQASDYRQQWQEHADQMNTVIGAMTGAIEYSDLGIIQRISAALPAEATLFTGNSTVVRMIGFFPPSCREIYSNRGTSGIDGCISTAVGIAMANTGMVFTLVGDQSFIYDSNALWNRSLPENLKIIVVNNQGGGIFGLLEGPSSTPAYIPYLLAHHPASISELSAAFGVQYHACRNYHDFDDAFENFVREKGPSVFEIMTSHEINTRVFRNFVINLKKRE
jgi:2-succinyl-5-enolpyruvyl-6-hydroxy-3-cyclohexene-1-carboxylate synthase